MKNREPPPKRVAEDNDDLRQLIDLGRDRSHLVVSIPATRRRAFVGLVCRNGGYNRT